MSSVLRPVRKRKKGRMLGPVKIIRREDYSDLELDAKVELIRSLVPLGLMHVEELLDEEVTALAGERYARKDASVGGRRHGSNPGTVGLAGQRVPMRVPRIRHVTGSEMPLRSYEAVHGDRAVNDLLLKRVLYGISCRNYEALHPKLPALDDAVRDSVEGLKAVVWKRQQCDVFDGEVAGGVAQRDRIQGAAHGVETGRYGIGRDGGEVGAIAQHDRVAAQSRCVRGTPVGGGKDRRVGRRVRSPPRGGVQPRAVRNSEPVYRPMHTGHGNIAALDLVLIVEGGKSVRSGHDQQRGCEHGKQKDTQQGKDQGHAALVFFLSSWAGRARLWMRSVHFLPPPMATAEQSWACQAPNAEVRPG